LDAINFNRISIGIIRKGMQQADATIKQETIIAACEMMCPDSELELHKTNPVAFEQDSHGKFQFSLAIKKFNQPAVGNVGTAQDIRTIPTLQRTVAYILEHVIGEMTGTSPGRLELVMYGYM
jgi:hypothetical protein